VTNVRFADSADIAEIARLGKIMHDESPRFSKFPYSPKKASEVRRRTDVEPSELRARRRAPAHRDHRVLRRVHC
jgi:hypothetical protein